VLAENIDDVVRLVGDVVDQARTTGHRRGYFAAIYLDMTRAVQEGIAKGVFDDGPRMSRFAAAFANRYLDALATFAASGEPTRVWRAAFGCNKRRDRLILQQIVIGINAHVNLDLGVAAAEVVEPGHIDELKGDFDRINTVIGSLLDPIQESVGRFSPLLDLLWRIDDCADDEVLNFSFSVAREEAWQNAVVLSGQPPEQRAATIQSIDRSAALLARLVIDPSGILGKTVSLVRHTEHDDPPAVIDSLASISLPA
jgi:hypothetical protein